MKRFKHQDNLILSELRTNARESLKKVGKKHNIPHSTVHDKVKNYEKNIIHKHTSILNFSELGFDCRATFVIKLEGYHPEKLMKFINDRTEINNAYEINHGYDMLMECIFTDKMEMKLFTLLLKEKLPIKEVQIFEMLKDVKREKFMTNQEKIT